MSSFINDFLTNGALFIKSYLKDFMTIVSLFVGSYVALNGLNTWKKQQILIVERDLARRVLNAAYK